jgi:hypothetical protein
MGDLQILYSVEEVIKFGTNFHHNQSKSEYSDYQYTAIDQFTTLRDCREVSLEGSVIFVPDKFEKCGLRKASRQGEGRRLSLALTCADLGRATRRPSLSQPLLSHPAYQVFQILSKLVND